MLWFWPAGLFGLVLDCVFVCLIGCLLFVYWFGLRFGLLVLRAAFVLDGVAVVPGGLRLVDSGLV